MEFSSSQKKALSLLETGKNVFMTGKAGSGKSTVIQEFTRNKVDFAIVAPTGTAAINVGGTTIHQLFALPPRYCDPIETFRKYDAAIRNPKDEKNKTIINALSIIQEIEILIIDEIGMVRSDVFGCMDLICRVAKGEEDLPFGGIQVVAVGDLYQIPPVVTREERSFIPIGEEWFFKSPGFSFGNFEKIELLEVHRQGQGESVFVDALNQIREGGFNQSLKKIFDDRVTKTPDENALILCSRRDRAFQINQDRLDALKGKFQILKAETYGDEDYFNLFPVDEKIWLKKGAKIMFVVNNPAGGWFNGTTGEYLGKRGDMLRVRIGSKEVNVPMHEFEYKKYVLDPHGNISQEVVAKMNQYPIQLAWAITIHKSQGKSLNKVHLDLGHQGAFAHGQTYVGLSRCKSLQGLTLEHEIREEDIICDKAVKEFMHDAA